MTRWKLMFEYDGGAFVGWQRQLNGLSVQEVVEDAIFAFCGARVTTHVAGRTDAGVHALGQVAHFDLEKATDADTVRDAVNFHLRAHKVTVLAAQQVDADFHARFSAIQRAYLYRILDRRPPPALDRGRVWWVTRPLDAAAMAGAAALLPGKHDFSTFRAANCQADSPLKTLDVLTIERVGEEIHLRARARSFLYHQVRNIVGTLKLVGEGKWTVADLKRALEARDRSACGPVAPGCGLYLAKVDY